MYRRLGSKHLFQKLDGSSSLRMRPGQNDRSIRFLYYSLSYVNLFKDRFVFIALLSRRVLCSEKRVQGAVFFHTLQMFRKKSLRKLAVFRVILQNKGEKRVFLGKRQEKGDILGTRPPCHGGGLGGKTGPYRGKTMPWRGETRAGEQRKWGETDGNKSLLRLGSYFLLIIYIAQERRKWRLGRKHPLLPSWGGGQIHRPSFGMVSGWVRDGKPHTKKHISHASQATGPPHSNRLKSGVKNEVNFVAL